MHPNLHFCDLTMQIFEDVVIGDKFGETASAETEFGTFYFVLLYALLTLYWML